MFRPLLLVLALGVAHVMTAPDDKYSDKYDHIDAVTILANDPLREQYYDCFMDTGPCLTDDATFFKGNLPEAIATQCKKCTNRQLQMFEQIVDWYNANQPEKWTALMAKLLEDAKKLKVAGARK